MKARALVLAAFAGLTFSASSLAAPATTGAGQRLHILVTLTDKGLFVGDQAQMYRGSIITFNVYNAGKKAHGYTVLGKSTGKIKPRKWGKFTVTLLTRGRYPDGSPFDKGPAFHGFFTVY
jgi:hypothetical protein